MAFEIITATPTSFIYGVPDINGNFVFGVIITGQNLTYDPVTGLPVGGTVQRITETRVMTASDSLPDIWGVVNLPVSDVAALNAAGVNWFDAGAITAMAQTYAGIQVVLTGYGGVLSGWNVPVMNVVAGNGINYITGSSGDDTIRSGEWNDTLYGHDGNDQLYGGAGPDQLYGEAGDDYLNGASGYDRLFGGGGADTLDGGTGDDRMWGDGSGGAPVAEGGNDLLKGGGGNDVLFGDGGNDTLFGGNGDDSLVGGYGDDNLRGGNGNDHLYGNDVDPNSPVTGDNKLDGGAGNDHLIGGDGNDKLIGGTGNDFLQGHLGNDKMLGGDGDDYLVGDGGNDVMVGGAGADSFLFLDNHAAGSALVKDFDITEDRIAIQHPTAATAQDQYDMFMVEAVQVGSTVVWIDSSGTYTATFANLELTDLTVANFMGSFELA